MRLGVFTPNSMSIGSIGLCPYIRKYGLNPVAFDLVQLYACTRVARCLGQCTLASGGNDPIKGELNLSCWPFLCGLYGLVQSFLTCATWQSLFIKELSKLWP